MDEAQNILNPEDQRQEDSHSTTQEDSYLLTKNTSKDHASKLKNHFQNPKAQNKPKPKRPRLKGLAFLKLIVLLGVVFLANLFKYWSLFFLQDVSADTLHLKGTQARVFVFVFYVVYFNGIFLGCLFWNILSHKFSNKVCILVSLSLMSVLNIVQTSTSNWLLILVLR